MADKRKKVTDADALAVLVLGGLMRYGGSMLIIILQLATLTAGVLGLLAIVWGRQLAAIFLFPSAWVFWWVGNRLNEALREQPLDQAAQQKSEAADERR